jgi:Predicted transcriptional regulator
MTTAEHIRAIRASTGLTQAAFAARFSIPKRTYESWEMGERTPPPYVVSLLAAAVLAANDRQ